MDDLRNRVWDYLYQLAEPQGLHAIAAQLGEDPVAVQRAIEHPWFQVADGLVAIAYNA